MAIRNPGDNPAPSSIPKHKETLAYVLRTQKLQISFTTNMADQSQTQFLFTILKHSTIKLNTRHLSAALNVTPAAATMRMTRLKRNSHKPTQNSPQKIGVFH